MIAEDWEIVSRRILKPGIKLFWIVAQMLFPAPPINRSRMTFTLRQRSTI